MSFGDKISQHLGFGLRSLGAKYPTTYLVACGLGMATKIILHAISSQEVAFIQRLNGFEWYQYSLVWIALLLTPALLGKTRVPEKITENLQSLKLIVESSNTTDAQKRMYYDMLIRRLISEMGTDFREKVEHSEQPEAAKPQENEA